MSAERGLESSSGVPPGTRLGDYVLGEPLWRVRIADAYFARGPNGPATLYVIAATLSQHPEVRAEIIAGTRAAAALPEHPSIVRTVAAGLTGELLWIATADVDGVSLREVLKKKQRTGVRGLGAPGAALVVDSAAAALAQVHHGALTADSIVVSRSGPPRVADLALARGVMAANRLGLLPAAGIAPEVSQGAAPNTATDVYGLGSLLYEALVGAPLERGGPRPSEVVPSLPAQLDDVIARCCHRESAKRFGHLETLRELLGDLLGRPDVAEGARAGILAAPVATRGSGSLSAVAASSPSLAQVLADGGERATPATVDAALALALSDSAEKWLISKGHLDYGPFSLAAVVSQIEEGKILPSHVIVDNDTGARTEVGAHPLLGPISDSAKARLDEQRRVAAETAHRRTETTRGLMLYLVIGAAVLAVGGGAWWGVQRARNDETTRVAGVNAVGTADIDIRVSAPKRPPHRSATQRGRRPSENPGAGDEPLALDLGGDEDDDATETLDLDTIHKVYSRQGGALGRCLGQNGGGTANISFIIDGPSGRITVVRVNGKTTGGLAACVGKVMRSLSFPSINGPRTRAEFDISM